MTATVEQEDSADTAGAGNDPKSGETGPYPGFGVFFGLGATAAKSCCVLPLLLAFSGLGGAWISRTAPCRLSRATFSPRRGLPRGAGVGARHPATEYRLCVSRSLPSKSCRGARYSLLILSTLIVGLATAWERIEPAAMAALIRLTEGSP